MAIDYIHRLVVTGLRESVDQFRRQLRLTEVRSVAGQKWRETIPFSFKRLYELAPKAVLIEPSVPYDPYDMSVWPIRPIPPGLAELRYQFHTRNMELFPFVRVLSKELSSLEFRVVTHCMDDNEIASYRLCDGTVRKWIVPKALSKAHWERARQKFGLTGDDVYLDDEAEYYAEEGMREDALDHWGQDKMNLDFEQGEVEIGATVQLHAIFKANASLPWPKWAEGLSLTKHTMRIETEPMKSLIARRSKQIRFAKSETPANNDALFDGASELSGHVAYPRLLPN